MADTTTTSNMGLTIPTVSVRIGPNYAADVNGNFEIIADHDHSNSAKVTPAGLDITSDLSIGTNNLTNVRSLRLVSQSATLAGINDVGCFSNVNGDLYWNNNAGAQVKITSGGGINTGAIVTNVWGMNTITANLTILGSDSFTNIAVNSSSSLTINLPAANAVAAGRYYVIQDISGNSQTYNINLVPNGTNTINGSNSTQVLASNHGTWIVRSNGTSAWQLTFTGFSGLTAASLTYGTSVLNSSGLTLGSATLTSSALTYGTSSFSSSALTVGNSSLTSSTLTVGTNTSLTASSLAIGTNSSSDTSAVLRAPNNVTLVSARNAANSANLDVLKTDASNNVIAGNTGSALVLVGTSVSATPTGGIPANSGLIRVPNNQGYTARSASNSSDIELFKLDANDIIQIGDGNADSINFNDEITTSESVSLIDTRINLDDASFIAYSPARTVYRAQRVTEIDAGTLTGTWVTNLSGAVFSMLSQTTGAQRAFWLKDPPHGATLTSLVLKYNPGGSARSPSNRLGIQLWKVPSYDANQFTSTFSLFSSVTSVASAAVPVAAYSTFVPQSHTFTPDQNNVIDAAFSYLIIIVSESGTGAVGTVNSVYGWDAVYSLNRANVQ